jgi:hypothetical protein
MGCGTELLESTLGAVVMVGSQQASCRAYRASIGRDAGMMLKARRNGALPCSCLGAAMVRRYAR